MAPLVHVVWADLDRAAATALPRWREILSPDETARAERYRFARDRNRYVTRRGILRLLLARRLDRAPAALRFDANAYGKPLLIGGGCEFNLSHSRGLALFALGTDVAIGCDIEFHDRDFLAENIPERCFSSAELDELRATPAEAQMAAFFNGWTRKEAYIKARGLGMSLALDSFDVSLAPDERPALHRGCVGWSARTVAPAPDCSAAIIAAGAAWDIAAHSLDPLGLLDEALIAV
ncbi:MAG TPA: 4'-phosphopantetheinyl transferase superfamily protein [Stellaceae bacterium]|jgi:4'-phosphopantetheinyl transferase|nr:4'-phosphopantetheinyl transferase superfamily protein [Stellaceae bacterium]